MKKYHELIDGFYTDYDRITKSDEEKMIIANIYKLKRDLTAKLDDEGLAMLDLLIDEKTNLEKVKAKTFAKALINYLVERD